MNFKTETSGRRFGIGSFRIGQHHLLPFFGSCHFEVGDFSTDLLRRSIANTVFLNYTYNNDNLTAVTITDSSGNIDAFVDMTSRRVGSRILVSYAYGPGNDQLL